MLRLQPLPKILASAATIALTAALWVAFPAQTLRADTLDRILVVVNDEIITETDLNQALFPLVTRLRATSAGPELEAKILDVRKKVIQDMISDRLIISAARALDPKYKIAAEPAEIDEMVDQMRSKFPSEEVFQRVMKDQGVSQKAMRDRLRDDIMKRKMVDFKVKSRVTLSPGEIKNYFDAHPDDFKGVPEVKARQILVRAGETRSEELAQSTLQSIVDQLAQGADFAALAKEYSESSDAAEGGDMGWVRQGQFMERIDRAVFKLEPGQTSDPIKTQLGLHLFRVDEKRSSPPVTFQEAIPRIENYLYKKKMADELHLWITELKENSFISYQDPAIADLMVEAETAAVPVSAPVSAPASTPVSTPAPASGADPTS